MARAGLSEQLRGGLLGVASGEALGLAFVGRPPREIRREAPLDAVGPTGALTAGALGGPGTGDRLGAALAVGWGEPDRRPRRAAAATLGPEAIVIADLAAGALRDRPLFHAVADHGRDWAPPFRGVAGDDRAVIDALLALLARHDDPSDAMRSAVRLGGAGNARVAGLVGGLLGCRRPSAVDRVPWLPRIVLPDEAALARAVAALSGDRDDASTDD